MLRVASVIQPWFPVLLLTSCVTLGNLFRFSGPWFYYWRISRDDFYPAGCRAGETQECTRTTRHIVGSQCTVTESATTSRFLSPGQFENYLHYLFIPRFTQLASLQVKPGISLQKPKTSAQGRSEEL